MVYAATNSPPQPASRKVKTEIEFLDQIFDEIGAAQNQIEAGQGYFAVQALNKVRDQIWSRRGELSKDEADPC